MSGIWLTINDFYDQSAVLVGIKSGLLLSNDQINRILQKEFDDSFLKSPNRNQTIRIRPEEVTDMIRHIRVRIGNLPSPEEYRIYEYTLNEYSYSDEIYSIYNKWGLWARHQYFTNKLLNHRLLKQMIAKSERIHGELIDAMVYLIMRELDGILIFPDSKAIKDVSKLEDLFKCEMRPTDDNTFIDQKFIDYLAVNGADIELMHWRNFERFCAEYFNKKGFNVVLGPGSRDGGIDIRIFAGNMKKARPFIVLQCKRYKNERKVTIEAIKAFHSDLKFEGAKYGLIATTSQITKDGKKLVKARDYRISFAENKMIKNWAKEMLSF